MAYLLLAWEGDNLCQ